MFSKTLILIVCGLICGLNADSCPSYTSVPGFDFSKFTGTWYMLATDAPNITPLLSCGKAELELTPDSKFSVFLELVGPDGNKINQTVVYNIDKAKPGDVYFNMEVEDSSIFGSEKRKVDFKTSIIMTDYTDIAVSYGCFNNRQNFLEKANHGFAIFVRKRSFDSFTKFAEAVATLGYYGADLNKLKMIYNGPNCKND